MINIDVFSMPQPITTKIFFDPDSGDVEFSGHPEERHHASAVLGSLAQILIEKKVLTPREVVKIALHAVDEAGKESP